MSLMNNIIFTRLRSKLGWIFGAESIYQGKIKDLCIYQVNSLKKYNKIV